MLKDKCEDDRVPKDVELTSQKKIKMSKSKTKIVKGKMENQRKNDEK